MIYMYFEFVSHGRYSTNTTSDILAIFSENEIRIFFVDQTLTQEEKTNIRIDEYNTENYTTKGTLNQNIWTFTGETICESLQQYLILKHKKILKSFY